MCSTDFHLYYVVSSPTECVLNNKLITSTNYTSTNLFDQLFQQISPTKANKHKGD